MAYKKDQGRYARMVAFWGLFLLVAYGTVRPAGLVSSLRAWLGSIGGDGLTQAWIEPFPILERLDLAMLIALFVLAIAGAVIHWWLSRPGVADMLIDTEDELRKVTWPTFADTWKGALAVVATVAFLLVYLTGADVAISAVMEWVMRGGAS